MLKSVEFGRPSGDGVDLTLVRWMLDMTPAERLETLQAFVDAVWRVRGEDAATGPWTCWDLSAPAGAIGISFPTQST